MYKIIGIEQAWEASGHRVSKPRQMFVTRSRMLADQVWRTVRELHESFGLADMSEQQSASLAVPSDQVTDDSPRRLLPRRYSELNDEHFPLFVTIDEVRGISYTIIRDNDRRVYDCVALFLARSGPRIYDSCS